MSLDEFLAGAQMFTQGLQRLGVSQALNEANQKINTIQSEVQDQNERNTQLASASKDLTMRLSALGQSPQEIMSITSQLGPSQAELERRALRQQQIESKQKFEEKQATTAFGRQYALQERRLQAEKELAGMKTIQGVSEAQLKRQEEAKELMVPNLKYIGQGKPSKKDVEELKESQASAGEVFKNVKQFGKMISEVGSESPVGENYSKMETIRTVISGGVKQMEKLGALDQGVWEYVDRLLPDPTSVTSNIVGAIPVAAQIQQRNMNNKIKQAENYIRIKLKEKIQARGFQIEENSPLYQQMFVPSLSEEDEAKISRIQTDKASKNKIRRMIDERDINPEYDKWLKEREL